jgi:NADH-quinone oxidoreductase subunit C
MNARDLANRIRSRFGELAGEPVEFREEITLTVTNPGRIVEVCEYAKGTLGFDLLLDITSIDNYGDDPRWTLVYELYGLGHKCHLRLKTHVTEEASEAPTITGVWRTANWHEREIYDLMGIRFRGHPDLRRIIMWNGYPYFPLRKDFPLAGKPTELPDVGFSEAAPLEGGPFVTSPGTADAIAREPRVRTTTD